MNVHKSLAYIFRALRPTTEVSYEGSGFQYIVTPELHPNNPGRWALIRPYTLPKRSVYGRGHTPVLRSIGGPQPVVSNNNPRLLQVDPRGFGGGNGPTTGSPSLAELINNTAVNNVNAQIAMTPGSNFQFSDNGRSVIG